MGVETGVGLYGQGHLDFHPWTANINHDSVLESDIALLQFTLWDSPYVAVAGCNYFSADAVDIVADIANDDADWYDWDRAAVSPVTSYGGRYWESAEYVNGGYTLNYSECPERLPEKLSDFTPVSADLVAWHGRLFHLTVANHYRTVAA